MPQRSRRGYLAQAGPRSRRPAKHYQAAIAAAAREAGSWMTGKYDFVNPPAVKRLLSQGVQLRGFSQEILEAAYRANHEVCTEISQSNARFKRLYDSLTGFRADSYLWWQVAELPSDSFQIRMRARS